MFGQVSHDMEVDVAASSAWKLYGTIQLAKIVEEGLPHMVEKIEIIEGDGGVGTVLQLTFRGQGTPPPPLHIYFIFMLVNTNFPLKV